MEDADLVEQDLCVSSYRLMSYLGVYDGHCGRDCVDYVRSRLHLELLRNLERKERIDQTDDVGFVFGDLFGLSDSLSDVVGRREARWVFSGESVLVDGGKRSSS